MIDTQHPDLIAMADRWQRCRDTIAGEDAVKAAGEKYLPRPLGMDVGSYAHYKTRALYLPAVGRTVAALAGALVRRPPRVQGPDETVEHAKDLTLADESATAIARHVAHEILGVGRCGILVDMAIEGGRRPHWVTYRAEDIVNWRTARRGDDPVALISVVLREVTTEPTEDNPFAHEAVTTFRELALDDEGTYRVRIWRKAPPSHLTNPHADHWLPSEWIVPTRRGQPLPFIPFTFVGPSGITPAVETPPLLPLVDVSLSHYRSSADREHGLHYVALPTPWVSGAPLDAALKIGPAAVWSLPPDAKAGLLEFTGAGLAAIERAMKEKEAAMAALGAQLLESPALAASTATQAAIRHAGEMASLRTIAAAIGAGLTQALRIHEWWFRGVGAFDDDVRIDVQDDLDRVRLTPAEVQAALVALQASAISHSTFYALLEAGGWTRPGITVEEEAHAIASGLVLGTGDDE